MSRKEDLKVLVELWLNDVDQLAEKVAHKGECEVYAILAAHCEGVYDRICLTTGLARGELDFAPLT